MYEGHVLSESYAPSGVQYDEIILGDAWLERVPGEGKTFLTSLSVPSWA